MLKGITFQIQADFHWGNPFSQSQQLFLPGDCIEHEKKISLGWNSKDWKTLHMILSYSIYAHANIRRVSRQTNVVCVNFFLLAGGVNKFIIPFHQSAQTTSQAIRGKKVKDSSHERLPVTR